MSQYEISNRWIECKPLQSTSSSQNKLQSRERKWRQAFIIYLAHEIHLEMNDKYHEWAFIYTIMASIIFFPSRNMSSSFGSSPFFFEIDPKDLTKIRISTWLWGLLGSLSNNAFSNQVVNMYSSNWEFWKIHPIDQTQHKIGISKIDAINIPPQILIKYSMWNKKHA